jgi:hypothetical protein
MMGLAAKQNEREAPIFGVAPGGGLQICRCLTSGKVPVTAFGAVRDTRSFSSPARFTHNLTPNPMITITILSIEA